jgi:hypothetical protein
MLIRPNWTILIQLQFDWSLNNRSLSLLRIIMNIKHTKVK